MKPVASGCERTAAGWRNDDAQRLLAASDPQPDYARVNPYALPDPTAPEIAATAVGVQVDLGPMRDAFAALRAQADFVLVEGVGGWASPITATLDHADLARAFGLPVLLVVGLRLGCINHARLSERAIRADGLPLLGWVANTVDPTLAHVEQTLAILDRVLTVPRLGRLGHGTDATVHSNDLHDTARVADFRQGGDAGSIG